MGKKYIIELEDKPFHNGNGDFLYRVKGFNSLVFDMTGVGKLTPYTEPDLEQIRKEAYERGAEDMRKALRLLIDCDDDCLTIPDIFHTFREGSYHAVVRKHPAMEIIEKIRQYEQGKEEIKVGDEVIAASGKAVVTSVGPVYFEFVYANGAIGSDKVKNAKKTGRHSPEIAEVLQKMRGNAT